MRKEAYRYRFKEQESGFQIVMQRLETSIPGREPETIAERRQHKRTLTCQLQ